MRYGFHNGQLQIRIAHTFRQPSILPGDPAFTISLAFVGPGCGISPQSSLLPDLVVDATVMAKPHHQDGPNRLGQSAVVLAGEFLDLRTGFSIKTNIQASAAIRNPGHLASFPLMIKPPEGWRIPDGFHGVWWRQGAFVPHCQYQMRILPWRDHDDRSVKALVALACGYL